MGDIINLILRAVFTVTIFGCIPYCFWMMVTVLKKRWKLLCLQLSIPFAGFIMIAGLSWIANKGADDRYLEGLFDTSGIALDEPIFQYHSDRAFNGDGYSIVIYELPANVRARFEAVDEKLLTDFPKHPSYRDHWSFERWKPAPLDEEFQNHLNFALSSYDSRKEPELVEHFERIRGILSGINAYYAFFYSGMPGNIDFFIVDLGGNCLYFINHNT